MKVSFVSAVTALAIVTALAGCGGKAKYTVHGTIASLNNSGLILSNGGEDLAVASGATTFDFKNQIEYGTMYNISIKQQPDHMTCAWNNSSNYGSAGYNISIDALLTCVQNSYTLSGQFTGITPTTNADGTTTARTVTLVNGASTVTLSSDNATNGAGDFAFSTAVYDGQSYGVTVVPPTNGLSCTVANASGVMHETPISNVLVTCTSQ